MRQNRIGIVGCLAFLLVLFGTSGLAAAAPLNCATAGPPTLGVVTIPGSATANDLVTLGFNGTQGAGAPCGLLVLNASPSTTPATNLTIIATSIALTNSDIISTNANSSIRMTATNGNIDLISSTVKAHKILNFKCSLAGPVDCTFTSSGTASDPSEIVAATDFNTPNSGPGGTLIIDVEGDVNITNTAIHGGDEFKILSANGDIKIGPCPGGTTPGTCKDPLQTKVPPQCFNAAGQFVPCTVTFNTEAELHGVCFPDVPEPGECNGGFKEKRFEAKNGKIDVSGTTISAEEHMTFWCGPEGFFGANSNLSSNQEITIDCTRGPGINGGTIDLTNATVSAPNFISLKTESPGTIICGTATLITNSLLQSPASGCVAQAP